MRILTVIRDLGPGGTERVAQDYTLAYRSMGHEVAVLGFRGGGVRQDILEKEGILCFVGGEGVARIAAAVETASSWQPTLVHIHRFGMREEDTGFVLRSLKQALPEGSRFIETNVFSRADYSTDARIIDVHLQLSKWCLWKWKALTSSITPRPIGIIMPNIVDTSRFWKDPEGGRAFRSKLDVPQSAVVFGRVGQPIKWKWNDDIFGAFRQVAAYSDAHLLLVGLPAELQKEANDLSHHFPARVHQLPFLANDDALRHCYNAIDVFLHSSRIGESFGLVLAESLLCETPILTRLTPLRDNTQLEMVVDSGGGLAALTEEHLVKGMQRLAQNSSERIEMGARGAEFIRRTYNSSSIEKKLDHLLHHLMLASDRDDLGQRLEGDPLFQTHVSAQELRQLLELQGMSLHTRTFLMLQLAHQPAIHRTMRALKTTFFPRTKTGRLPRT